MQEKLDRNLLYKGRKSVSLNLVLDIIIGIFIVLFAAELVFNTFYMSIYVKGDSMLPTLYGAGYGYNGKVEEGGDFVFVNTKASPDYFDIVVVETSDYSGGKYDIIKRAIAFGGDTVKLEQGALYVKYKGEDEFTLIDEPYVASSNNSPSAPRNTFAEHTVKEGCMFLLGDNRNVSEDSRARGDFSLKSLVGVVPGWSLSGKSFITSLYTFFDFKLGFINFKNNYYGD